MTLPGPNQTGTADRRPRQLPSQVLAHMGRPRIKTPAQEMASALQINPVARDEGYADGAAGRPWSRGPDDADILSYAAGYAAGVQFGRRKGG